MSGIFRVKVEEKIGEGPSKPLGYMGYDEKGWIRFVDDHAALTFELYELDEDKKKAYLKVNMTGTPWDGYYLSAEPKKKDNWVGLYKWQGATRWWRDEGHMLCAFNDEHLSYNPADKEEEYRGYLHASDKYRTLLVDFVAA